jgi:hypothetical protein
MSLFFFVEAKARASEECSKDLAHDDTARRIPARQKVAFVGGIWFASRLDFYLRLDYVYVSFSPSYLTVF